MARIVSIIVDEWLHGAQVNRHKVPLDQQDPPVLLERLDLRDLPGPLDPLGLLVLPGQQAVTQS